MIQGIRVNKSCIDFKVDISKHLLQQEKKNQENILLIYSFHSE